MNFLLQHNGTPYFIIVIMGLILYMQYQSGIAKDKEIADTKVTAEIALESMGDIVAYTDSRFDKLEALKKTKWEEGKHEMVIYYDK